VRIRLAAPSKACAVRRSRTGSISSHVDDGSVDDTVSVVMPSLDKDPRLTYVRTRKGGAVSTLNFGIRLATSPFIAFLDSDDEYAPAHLRLRLDYFASHPAIDMISGGMRLVGPRSRRFVRDAADPGKRLHLSRCWVGGTFGLRRSVLNRARGFRKVFFYDYDLYRRLRAIGARQVQVAFPTYLYHLEGDDRMSLRQAPALPSV
jgi:glycosyltransferase involved in cell wall biosynthesis